MSQNRVGRDLRTHPSHESHPFFEASRNHDRSTSSWTCSVARKLLRQILFSKFDCVNYRKFFVIGQNLSSCCNLNIPRPYQSMDSHLVSPTLHLYPKIYWLVPSVADVRPLVHLLLLLPQQRPTVSVSSWKGSTHAILEGNVLTSATAGRHWEKSASQV